MEILSSVKGESIFMSQKKEKKINLNELTEEELLKYEVAEELGLLDSLSLPRRPEESEVWSTERRGRKKKKSDTKKEPGQARKHIKSILQTNLRMSSICSWPLACSVTKVLICVNRM